jgi:Protein of unknown function (DUF2934)
MIEGMSKDDQIAAARPKPEAIAKRAYELYLQRGSEAGYEVEDWLSAEAELTAAAAEPSHAVRPEGTGPSVDAILPGARVPL